VCVSIGCYINSVCNCVVIEPRWAFNIMNEFLFAL